MTFGFFYPTGSFFERAHPVAKLLGLLASFVPPFFGATPGQVLPYFILLLLAALLGRAGANLVRMYKLMVILFVMSLLIWTIFERGGTVWLELGLIDVTREGFFYGMTVGLRLNCFILAAILFLTSTPIEDFTYALLRLGLPFAPSFTLTLAFRLTPLFMETGQTIVLAQKARGLDLDSGTLLQKIRNYVPIIVPVLVSGMRRGDQLAMALESRGFGKGGRRTFVSRFSVTWRDWVLLSVLLLAGLLMGLRRFL